MTTPIDQLIDDYLADSSYINEHTLRRRAQALNTFRTCNIPLDHDCLKHFDQALSTRGLKPRSRAGYVSDLRLFIVWLDANDRLPAGISRGKAEARYTVHRGRKRSEYRYKPRQWHPRIHETRFAFDNEPLSIYPYMRRETLRNRAIMHVLFDTGMRRHEVVQLRRAHIENGNTEIVITGKGNKDRTMYLTHVTLDRIRDYLAERPDDHPALFVAERNTKWQPLGYHAIYGIVIRAGALCGIKTKCTPHLIRHWLASDMLNRGVPLEIVQEYLGHASPETTRIVYAHTRKDTLRHQVGTYFHLASAGQPERQRSLFNLPIAPGPEGT